ncbi:hypothetical protein J437_LFUL014681, partial [Ladona fulva]
MAHRRKCKFNDNLQKEFEFIKKVKPEDEHEVRCTVCGTHFSVALFSGRTDIIDHISSKKHERALKVQAKHFCLFIKGRKSENLILNHHDLKLVPVMVKYFMPYEGVKIKVFEFKELPGETAKLISDHLKEDQNHLQHKVIAFGSDNTNSMMSKQGGKDNVLHLFKEDVGSDVIGI